MGSTEPCQDPELLQRETTSDSSGDPEPDQDSEFLQGEQAPVPVVDIQPNEDLPPLKRERAPGPARDQDPGPELIPLVGEPGATLPPVPALVGATSAVTEPMGPMALQPLSLSALVLHHGPTPKPDLYFILHGIFSVFLFISFSFFLFAVMLFSFYIFKFKTKH